MSKGKGEKSTIGGVNEIELVLFTFFIIDQKSYVRTKCTISLYTIPRYLFLTLVTGIG